MEQESTLYRQIARQLLQDIYKETYAYGTRLPSLQALCERFSAGRNTIRAALALLEADGVVHREKGSCARVRLDIHQLESNPHFLYRMACSKQGIAHAYDALGMLMPVAIQEALKQSDATQLEELQQGVRQLTQQEHTLYELNEALQQLYLKVLGFLHNPYLQDLVKQLLDFLYLPYAHHAHSEEVLADNKVKLSDTLARILLFVVQNNPFMMKKTIRYFCDITKKNSNRYLNRVCAGITAQRVIEFEWYTGREVSYLYMQTAGYLLQDIAENCYPNGQLLNLEQLAKRYAVSLRTMRRTMKFMNDLNLVETVNGLGSRSVYSCKQTAAYLQDAQVQALLEYYSCSLELLELVAKASLASCMERCPAKELYMIGEAVCTQQSLSPKLVLDILKHHENPCICNIVEQIETAMNGSMLIRTLLQRSPDAQTQTALASWKQQLKNKEIKKAVQLTLELLQEECSYWKQLRDENRSG